MRWLRENFLRIMALIDIFISTFLLLMYILTGVVKLMIFYYMTNLGFMLVVLIYAISLFRKRDRIEKKRRHIDKIEEEEK